MLSKKQRKWLLNHSGKDITIGLYRNFLARKISREVLLEALKFKIENNQQKIIKPISKPKQKELLNLVGEVFNENFNI